MSKTNKNLFRLFAAAFVVVVTGCGFSDYPGHVAHKTDKEAFIPSLTTVIEGFGDEYDGTFVYSVKYDNRKWYPELKFKSKLTTYRNKVPNSLPNRPGIVTDANGFEGATGFSGGVFKRYWTAIDTDRDVTTGFANLDQTHPLDADGNWIAPVLVFVFSAPTQEVDTFDWDLQSTIKNASQLLSSLIDNGGALNNLTMSVNAIELNGQKFPVEHYKLTFSTDGTGSNKLILTNQTAVQNLIKIIINNTENLEQVDLKLFFDNGMEIPMPKNMSVIFNHTVLKKLAN